MYRRILIRCLLVLVFLLSVHISVIRAAEFVIKYPHGHVTTHPQGIGAEHFKKRVHELTQGRVEVRVYPRGELFKTDAEYIDACRLGTVQVGSATCAAVVTLTPEYDIFSLPFLFRDYEHIRKVLAGPLGEILRKSLEKHGLHVLGFTQSGFRQLYTKKPIRSVKDVEGITIRAYEVPGIIETWKALKARPIPVAWTEVYTALQTGIVEASEASIQGWLGSKHYEQAPYAAIINYMDSGRVYFMNKKFWTSLPDDLRELIQKAWKEAEDLTFSEYVRQDLEAEETAKKVGAKFTYPPLEPFVEAVQPVYKKFKPALGEEWIEKIRAIK